MVAHIGSSTKSIPSRRACFAAGTKSLSPAIRMIWSTFFWYAREAISSPIFISTPFCWKVTWKSFLDKSVICIFPASSCFNLLSFSRKLAFSSESSPSLSATFRCCFSWRSQNAGNQYLSAKGGDRLFCLVVGSHNKKSYIMIVLDRIFVHGANVRCSMRSTPERVFLAAFSPIDLRLVSDKILHPQE